MKKIIGILRPFDTKQQIFVLEDGNKLDATSVSIEDFPKSILSLSDKYEASQVDLSGPKQYTKGVQNQIEAIAMNNYSHIHLDINLI